MRRIALERLTEPLHLNFLSLFVMAFGSYRQKVLFDLVVRQQYAFPILWAADSARRLGIAELTLIEFGVASGAGLLNMCDIAAATTKATGVRFRIYGFDLGSGLPAATDYRDLPETFQASDYPMLDADRLRASLPANAELVIGEIGETAPAVLGAITAQCPIGFVSVDVDYWSSTKDCLTIFNGAAEQYLPVTPVYLDDIEPIGCNPWTGEYLAMREFNEATPARKIAPHTFLRANRLFKNAAWIDRLYFAHIHDHPTRSPTATGRPKRVLENEYL